MATKKISELEAITEADDSDVLAIVDVSEGKTNKITKNNLLIGAGHSIEMSLNQETYALTLALKNAAGTELSTASIDLPNENSITNISYNNGKLTLTKQSGTTTEVDISRLIEGLATETALNNLANALKETIGIQTNTYDNTKTYNTGDTVVQNEKIYKANQDNITGTFDSSKWDEISLYEYQKLQDEAIEENYKVVTKLQEENEDLKKNQLTYTPTPATSHYLQDSADSRFRKFIPIGRTTQESNNNVLYLDEVNGGSNEIAPTLTNGVVHVKGNNNSSYNSKGFYQNGFVNLKNTQKWKSNTRYYISCKIEVISNPKGLSTSSFVAYIYGEKNTSLTYNSSLGRYVGVIDTSELTEKQANKTMLEIRLDGTEVNISEVSIKTEDNYTFTGYGNYPSPEMESPIKNTGDNVNEFDENILKQYKDDEDEEAYIFDNQTLHNKDLTPNIEFKENTSYAIQYIAKQVSGNPRLQVVYTDNTSENIPSGGIISTNYEKYTIITNGNKTVKQVMGIYSSNVEKAFYIKKNSLKLEPGTQATPYSPYGCGNVNEKVHNNNLFDKSKATDGYINFNDGSFTASEQYTSSDYIQIEEGQQYYSNYSTFSSSSFGLAFYNKNKKYIRGSQLINKITVPDNAEYIRFCVRNSNYSSGTYITDINTLYFVKGNSPTPYVPHSEQNISFPLGEGQKFYEGSYPDDDEKVHHKRAEYVMTGNESLDCKNVTDENIHFSSGVLDSLSNGKEKSALCTHFKLPVTSLWSTDIEGFSIVENYYHLRFRLNKSKLNDISTKGNAIDSFRAYLRNQYANGTPVRVVFELAEEQTEDFTEEQKTAWKEWKKARTYKNVTHISSEDETPANVEIEYVQDTKTYIDNKVTALTNAITSLGGNV